MYPNEQKSDRDHDIHHARLIPIKYIIFNVNFERNNLDDFWCKFKLGSAAANSNKNSRPEINATTFNNYLKAIKVLFNV